MVGPIERLSGPKTNICWTQDNTPVMKREQVSLVREADLKKLEQFFNLPIHQQIRQVETTIRNHIRETKDVVHPRGTFLLNAAESLKIAQSLTFAYFCQDITLTEVTAL